MNPPSMETLFLILSGVILISCILYWFWSHIQLTQKKVQLLENAVFELRGMMTRSPEPPEPIVQPVASSGNVYRDLDDDDWRDVTVNAVPMDEIKQIISTPPTSPSSHVETSKHVEIEQVVDELQPGGRIIVPSEEDLKEVSNEKEQTNGEQFRELFTAQPTPPASVASSSDTLEGMPVKELRRLAESRGIAGADGMRKKELLSVLRRGTEQTLDLTHFNITKEDESVEASVLAE